MGKQVLIVNYEPKSLARLNELVVDLGLEVVTAKNGQEALDQIRQAVPDMVIIDPMLPKVSGFEVAQQLHEAHPDTPIIMITSVYKGNRYRTEATTKYGVREYVEEPYHEDQLKGLIRKHLGMEQPAPPKPKKASTRRRLEEILEETISGGLPSGAGTTRKAPKPAQDEVLTSEEIFSDVIADVESAPVASKDSVEAAVEEKLEQTLSGLKVPSKKKARKEKPADRPAPSPEVKAEAPAADSASAGSAEPEIKRKEVEVQSAPRKPEPETEAPKRPGSQEGIEYGSYVLLEKVATGGMAELFKAKRRGVQGFQKIVAIKRILSHLVDNEEFVTMFIDEAKLAAQLNHPNIAQIYDLGKIENSFYIAMEYVEGYDLRNILKECRKQGVRIPEPLVLFIAGKVLSALDYAHRKKGLDMKDLKIVHRDISPQNILISKGGDVKLVDFGIAKAATKASQTQAGALKGKLLYMSPEQAYGKQIDSRSDLFSLGSVMYESLTGKKCFLADSEISILEKVRKVEYTPIREVEPSVSIDTEMIISRALAKNMDERFQSAKEMESEIHDHMESLPFAVSERVLARFVNALYEGDRATIEEIETKYGKTSTGADVEPEPAAPAAADPAATVRMSASPVEKSEAPAASESADEISVSEEDLAPAGSRVNETGTVIMPDLEEVEREEEEQLEHFGEASSSRSGLLIAVIVVVAIVGALGYFWWKGKQKGPAPAQQVQQPAPASATPAVTPGEQSETGDIQSTGADMASGEPTGDEAGVPGEGTAPQGADMASTPAATLNLDREKLVQQLLEKKLAEQEALLKAQQAQQQSRTETPQQLANRPATQPDRGTQTTPAPRPQPQQRVDAQPEKPVTTTVTEQPQQAPETTSGETTTEQPESKPAESTTATQPEATPPVTQPTETTLPASTKPNPAETRAVPESKPESEAVPVPVQPQVKEGDLVPLVEGEVIFPKVVKEVKPRVTPIARKRKIHGVIQAQALVDENGDVVDVVIVRNIPGRHGLDKEVIRAMKKWKFTPAIKQGVRVKVYYTQAFTF